ncbi:MAG: hypothetical protein QXL15_03395 [Candidatus Korarchaeota archaeon]
MDLEKIMRITGIQGILRAAKEKQLLVVITGAILVALMFITFRLVIGTNIITEHGALQLPALGLMIIAGMAISFAYLPLCLLGINDIYRRIPTGVFIIIYLVLILLALPTVTIGFFGALILSLLASMGWGVFQGYAAIPKKREGINKLVFPIYSAIIIGLFIYYAMHVGSEPSVTTYVLGVLLSFALFIRSLGLQIEKTHESRVDVIKKEQKGISAFLPNIYFGGFSILSLIMWTYLCNFITINALNAMVNSSGTAFSYLMQSIGIVIAWLTKPSMPKMSEQEKKPEREIPHLSEPIEPLDKEELRKPTVLSDEDLL